MKELFESLWKVAPRLMSVIVIVSALYFVAYSVVSFQHKLETMDKRLTNLEVRMDRLEGRMDRLEGRMDRVEEKLDLVIEYMLTGDQSRLRKAQQLHSGK